MDYTEGIQVLREAQLRAPALVHYQGAYHVFSRHKLVSSGLTIIDALREGGFLPVPERSSSSLFKAKEFVVHYKGHAVATATSKTMAVRIANALNEYVAGERAV